MAAPPPSSTSPLPPRQQQQHHQSKFLSWKYLSAEQLAALRTASHAGVSARQLLAQCGGLLQSAAVLQQQQPCEEQQQDEQQQQQESEQQDGSASGGAPVAGRASAELQLREAARLRREIELDLFSYALQQGAAWDFDDERLSVLVGLVKEAHDAAVGERQTIERSFACFKDALLMHSVHRPPFSCGVFSQAEMRAVLDWVLSTLYQHYKLYQYAFTERATLSLTTFHPRSLVEAPPACLPPLAEALTEAQHQQQLDEQQRADAEAAQRTAEAAEVEAAAAAARALQDEYEASLPEDIRARVAAVLEREAAVVRRQVEAQFEAAQAGLLAKLAQLEARVA